jgi:hypothetical protein
MLMDDLRRSLTHILQCFLDCAIESQLVILESGAAADEFVQFKLHHRILYGEVGSRMGCRRGAPTAQCRRPRIARRPRLHPWRSRAQLHLRQPRAERAVSGGPVSKAALRGIWNAAREPVGPQRCPGGANARRTVGAHAEGFHVRSRRPASRGVAHHAGQGVARAEVPRRTRVAQQLRRDRVTSEELDALRREVEEAGSWEALPGWTQDWIRKAEEGPLWVVLGR